MTSGEHTKGADLRFIDGLYVGQLNNDELKLFDDAVNAGIARRSYEGPMGFLGCAVVRINPTANDALTRFREAQAGGGE